MVNFKDLENKINKGAIFNINIDDDIYRWIIGGIINIKDNWFLIYATFPEGEEAWHDCIITNLKETDNYSYSFTDQIGREVFISSMEEIDKEEIKEFSDWKKNEYKNFKEILDRIKKDRLENSMDYIGKEI